MTTNGTAVLPPQREPERELHTEVTVGDERFVMLQFCLDRSLYDAVLRFANLHGIEPTTAMREAIRTWVGDA